MTTEIQLAPHSKESEMMVLGCMLTSINGLNISASSLDDADFYFTEHKIIFQVLKAAYKKDKPVDIHLVAEELKRQDKLNAVGGVGYLTTLAQYAGTSAFIEEYVDILKKKATLRKMLHVAKEMEKKALKGSEDIEFILEEFSSKIKLMENSQGKNIPIIDPTERLKLEDEFLNNHRGKKYLGLRVKTIKEFNEKLLGLRGLILLAAAPNVGKTALTVQTALEVLCSQEETCLVYISLEMTEEQIFRRMLLNLSGLSFKSFVFGTQTQQIITNDGCSTFFKLEEVNEIESAYAKIKNLGKRLQIIDQSKCPWIDSRTVINYIEAVKQETKTSRVIVIIDYLQVWPTSHNGKFFNENEADKWRIGEMKKIRDAINGDPVIVISEARKPSGKEDSWGGDLSDVMGSARGTYTPDVVMLLSQITPQALIDIWNANDMPKINTAKIESTTSNKELLNIKEGLAIKECLSKNGIAICKIEVPKVRDGMQRFSVLLEFHFHKNIFKPIDWANLKGTLDL